MPGVMERLAQQAEDAERQAARYRKMLDLARELGDEGLTELIALVGNGDAANGTNGNGHANGDDGPRGREAVRRIVAERPGVWTLAELRTEMEQRGWFTSQTGLEAAVKRLCTINGEGRKDGRGRYVFPANHGEGVDDGSGRDGAAQLARFG